MGRKGNDGTEKGGKERNPRQRGRDKIAMDRAIAKRGRERREK
jgi:hypothetical protein